MIATFTLPPASSKRLIAMGVAKMTIVREAIEKGRIIIAGGTTNGFVAEALSDLKIEEKAHYTAGIITDARTCVSDQEMRISPLCLDKGQPVEVPWEEFLQGFGKGDVFIKGANALDHKGRTGVLLGSPTGGTVGAALGILASRGSHLVVPVGHEKMIPSCAVAVKSLGIFKVDQSLGMRAGFIMLPFGEVITEIQALEQLYDIEANVVAAGGVGGSEGSVVMAVEGKKTVVEEVLSLVKKLHREKPVTGSRQKCKGCGVPCNYSIPTPRK
ncbi:MAG: hypothetical protein ACM3UZ_11095 [Acidobacteriota bacterium]